MEEDAVESVKDFLTFLIPLGLFAYFVVSFFLSQRKRKKEEDEPEKSDYEKSLDDLRSKIIR